MHVPGTAAAISKTLPLHMVALLSPDSGMIGVAPFIEKLHHRMAAGHIVTLMLMVLRLSTMHTTAIMPWARMSCRGGIPMSITLLPTKAKALV